MINEITDKSKNNYKGNPNRSQENLFTGTLAKCYKKFVTEKRQKTVKEINAKVKVLNPDGSVKKVIENAK